MPSGLSYCSESEVSVIVAAGDVLECSFRVEPCRVRIVAGVGEKEVMSNLARLG